MPLPTVPYSVPNLSAGESLARAQAFYEQLNHRRTVREYLAI